ncbi:uncharacterized protein B0I36DRAFT_347671 [Microdochium trichocladiopsis]|uniref:Uncharacterized protein n=1 Tax=Microdochium trichocladiopsis TaxID=1682393 RepID=A0A9P8YCW9_9PEZI|nr:uncharacterized protein B0I36DRAFT_347671 [Microdochium trichocladiopsis]KAH7035962.1 hypothetical protein B0I36DRAFT_347671 [Microdochium trichocladiopsis]
MAGEPRLQSPTTPQAVTDRQRMIENMSVYDILGSMKKAPAGQGIDALGYDGVLRRFDGERNVVDAVGLNPAQIREYYDELPLPPRFLTADGRNISHWDMLHPAAENVPKKISEEDKARILAHNEELARRGVLSCVSSK